MPVAPVTRMGSDSAEVVRLIIGRLMHGVDLRIIASWDREDPHGEPRLPGCSVRTARLSSAQAAGLITGRMDPRDHRGVASTWRTGGGRAVQRPVEKPIDAFGARRPLARPRRSSEALWPVLAPGWFVARDAQPEAPKPTGRTMDAFCDIVAFGGGGGGGLPPP